MQRSGYGSTIMNSHIKLTVGDPANGRLTSTFVAR
jgi:hypothetical protein